MKKTKVTPVKPPLKKVSSFIKKDANEVRTTKFTTVFSINEIALFDKLSKELQISKTELIVRSIKQYQKFITDEVSKNQLRMDI